MIATDHTTLNVRFFLSRPGQTDHPAELPELDMYSATTIPAIGDLVHSDIRSPAAAAYQVISRHFDPANRRVGVIVEEVRAPEHSPFR
ncbi:hypothetical protein [Tateyamaria sp. syn59]|uniref:hypothetical protein n=1 Tax=Tateyamaria sp. syn59 TaxID=2576942 RepID=UPI0011BF2B27|nr:hypothetical protein [Tateyamaria sp. syn59]